MKYIVSACLLGENCKYNGGNNANKQLIAFLKDQEYIAVCPERLGGLPTPRPRSERFQHKVMNEHGEDITAYFIKGAQLALQQVKEWHGEIAILQARSPSCGIHQIYDGTFQGRKIAGDGIFAQLLCEQGYPVYDIDEFFQK